MIEAHTQVYLAIKKKHPSMKVGISHDPIRFRTFHKLHPLWTPIEKMLCRLSHGDQPQRLHRGVLKRATSL